ncbi:transporter [Fulvitalea axinellae]|uniref:Transporter n=1 Tax=Fulvitalea axinellae TaxID=1182444 RepID=A0AAU9CC20_9BACT|nr:transporter [Fulvitalea axinellae]
MRSTIFALALVYICVSKTVAQTTADQVISQIERNNLELKALRDQTESQKLGSKTENNLPDPEVSAYYLPYGTHTGGDYTEFQFSQSFEFPTVYLARKKMIGEKQQLLDLEYGQKRQQILAKAEKHFLRHTYLSKTLDHLQDRLRMSEKVYSQTEELYSKGQINLLELNKAKVVRYKESFELESVENEKLEIEKTLKAMNGNQPVEFATSEYGNTLTISSEDSLWAEKERFSPELLALSSQERLYEQALKVQQRKNLPDISLGANIQGVHNERHAGFYGGISLPLWRNKNKVKTAKAKLSATKSLAEAKLNEKRTEFSAVYETFRKTLVKFREYQTVFGELNDENLLLKAYCSGEISYTDYYNELRFYRQAADQLLKVEFELHQLKAELLKHRL